jgi:DNA (cytosine-5)-methyltransferase 1
MKLRVVDLFCGGGGLSQGLMDAGFEIVAAIDNWPVATSFYESNIKGHPVLKEDIADLDLMIPLVTSYEPDVIAGGPPCQDFSSAGKRNEGQRADLTVGFARLVAAIKPKFFIMENVQRARKSSAYAAAIATFKEAGYGITEAVLNAALCGVPQIRKRIIVFGEMGGLDNALVPVYQERQSDQPMTMRNYFGDELGIEHYYRHPRSYARRAVFSIDEPSPTIRGVNRPIPKGYPGHKGDSVPVTSELRILTTKERSMIQTFPKIWKLSGSKTDMEQIIGNAVPCNLARFVGECIFAYLNNRSFYAEKTSLCEQLTLFEQRATYRSCPSFIGV